MVTSDQSGVAKNQNTNSSAQAVSMSAESYTPGSYYRDYTGMFTTAQANDDRRGMNDLPDRPIRDISLSIK